MELTILPFIKFIVKINRKPKFLWYYIIISKHNTFYKNKNLKTSIVMNTFLLLTNLNTSFL